ncbi:MAG: rod shape-determining protein MreC [bacterium]|nr:rod shape-determining protein MreC [bacterium]
MQRLYAFWGDNRGYVILGVAVLLSLVLMALGPSSKLALVKGVATTLTKSGHQLFSWPIKLAGLRFENGVLREQNLRLSLELMQLREARLENQRLHDLLDFKEQSISVYLASRVIAQNPGRISNTVLLDVGASNGVEEKMSVVTAEGLVGRVLEVHPFTAVVQLLLDRNCRVSAIVQRESRTQGIVMCENGTFYLNNVPVRGEIEVGDRVVSSGLGEIFPKGLLVGVVEKVGEEGKGLFKEVVLKPGVNFRNLEEVFVLKREVVDTSTH